MNDSRIRELKAVHESAVMVGWEFSLLDSRLASDEEPWDFDSDCSEAMPDSGVVVDLGTGGGGESDSPNSSPIPASGDATEGWVPNVEVARKNLAPYGIEVQHYDSECGDTLPFADESVALVMSRHESFDAAEIARVLKPGGRFLTQQVDGFDMPEIHEWF